MCVCVSCKQLPFFLFLLFFLSFLLLLFSTRLLLLHVRLLPLAHNLVLLLHSLRLQQLRDSLRLPFTPLLTPTRRRSFASTAASSIFDSISVLGFASYDGSPITSEYAVPRRFEPSSSSTAWLMYDWSCGQREYVSWTTATVKGISRSYLESSQTCCSRRTNSI